ncbi:putative addiction module antidote protein [Erwinia rhapontici]|uniref:addiction module antidote protein n=1 Tax=Erwinia rhapontici TaxID=55212 RepID=UPI001D0DA09E|nr:addiction module antidote protein [Erwinia rhapontici]UDQ81933.1 putative addiction module antidote protein [Erwinia rhapontici]
MHSKATEHDSAVIDMLREDPGFAQVYLQTALEDIYEDGGVGAFLTALRHVVNARGGIGEIAAKSGLSREQLYRTLSDKGNPTLKTLTAITRAADVRLFAKAAGQAS